MKERAHGEAAAAVIKVLKAVAEMYGVELAADDALDDEAGDGGDGEEQELAVYFVRAGADGPIKIGATSDVTRRLPAMQTANAAELRVLAVVPPGGEEGGFALERRIHEMFAADRIRGEWFQPSARLLAWIKQNADTAHVCWGEDDIELDTEPMEER